MQNSVDDLFGQALALFSQGQEKRAEDICRNILKINSNQSDVCNLLSVIESKKGNLEQAIKYAEQSIKINPNNHLYYTNLGEFHKRNGDIEKAIKSLIKAIQTKPDFHGSRYNLANIYKSIGKKNEAETLYKEAISLNPDDYQSLQNLGNLYIDEGAYSQAIDCYYSYLRIDPGNIEIENNLARAFLEIKNYYQAEYFYKAVLAKKHDHTDALKSLSIIFENAGRFDEAVDLYKKYIKYSSSDPDYYNKAKALHLEMTTPAFDLTNYDIDTHREKLFNKIDDYRPLYSPKDEYKFINENLQIHSQFAYHGRDNKDLKEKYSLLFENCFPQYELSFNQGKIRLGFLVTLSNENIFSKFMAGIINNLPTEDFEIYIICHSRGWEKTLKNRINNQNVKLAFLTDTLLESSQNILNLKLDILYHWEVGTDATNYFLAYFRLAPVQCTSIGWPDTTGIKTVDYFISGELIEADNSENHYTEKLAKFKKLPFIYQKPQMSEPLSPIEEFDLSKENNIYLCSQNLRKIHPDFDELIARILRKDPKGIVVFVKLDHEQISDLLKVRINVKYPDIAKRVVFLNRLSFNKYLSLIHHSDVVLDTLYFGGANTSYETFAMNTPIVTFPWTHERGRYTLGCYKQMGIDGLVADSFEEYIDLAVKTATDIEFRDKLVNDIKNNNHKLYNDQEVTGEYINFFKSISRNDK